ncbi:Uncharacterised protein [Acinetobacter baumannii]|nr:Uncharacterised protein [Acinetobacter baumannii]
MDNKLLEYCNEIASAETSYPDLQLRNVIGRVNRTGFVGESIF